MSNKGIEAQRAIRRRKWEARQRKKITAQAQTLTRLDELRMIQEYVDAHGVNVGPPPEHRGDDLFWPTPPRVVSGGPWK